MLVIDLKPTPTRGEGCVSMGRSGRSTGGRRATRPTRGAVVPVARAALQSSAFAELERQQPLNAAAVESPPSMEWPGLHCNPRRAWG